MQKQMYHFPKKTIRDIDVRGKRILLRADFNVPLSETGEILSDYRITQTVPTLRYLLERNATVIIIAHLGRPEGKPEKKFSLQPVATALRALLPEYPVTFVDSTIDDKAWQTCKAAPASSITLLENLRFDPGEEANDHTFAASLQRVSHADYFVQDGFGVVHRAHASTEAITHLLPSVAGLLLEKEVSVLQKAMAHPDHPVVAVVGGAKISDKIGFIERLLAFANTILIGGAMANTFLKQEDISIGRSKFEDGQEREIKRILELAKPGQLVLPVDVGVGSEVSEKAVRRDCGVSEVSSDEYILDIGPKTMELFDSYIQKANTVIWNGTLGYAEAPQFATASAELARTLAAQQSSLTSIIGGGDTAEFVLEWQQRHKGGHFTHISTGGGASLELMSGLKLPGVEALLS